MRKLHFIYLVIIALIVSSCKSQMTDAQRSSRDKQLNELSQKIAESDYEILMTAAFPLSTNSLNGVLNDVFLPNGDSASRIDLTDRRDFIQLSSDSTVVAKLSYYGERRVAGSYGSQDAGIVFKGIPRNYKQNINYDKGCIEMDYQISNQTESFDVSIQLFYEGNANVNINTSHRSNIRYSGKLEQMKEVAL